MIKFDLSVPETILTDQSRLQQIVRNLVSNAIKYTHRGSIEISVKFDNNKSLLMCSISDTGVGITDQNKKKVFKPFQRFRETENMNNEGIGIGLCVSRKIVKSLDGKISFVSEPTVRQGSTFTFTIMATNPF